MFRFTLLKGVIFGYLFQLYLTMEHKLKTTEPVEMAGLPILQTVLHENFLQLRFDRNWKAKSMRFFQFGNYQSEDNEKIRILILYILKVKATFPLNSFIVLHYSAGFLLDQMTFRTSS